MPGLPEPLKFKKKHLDFSWWEVRVNVSDFLIWGAKSLQWFRSEWSQPYKWLFSVYVLCHHQTPKYCHWLKIKLWSVSQINSYASLMKSFVQRYDAFNFFVSLGFPIDIFNSLKILLWGNWSYLENVHQL